MPKKKRERLFFTLNPYRKIKFTDPCKNRKCLIKSCCTKRCDKRIRYNKSVNTKETLLLGGGMYTLMAGLGFLFGALTFSGHIISGISGLTIISLLWLHILFLIDN